MVSFLAIFLSVGCADYLFFVNNDNSDNGIETLYKFDSRIPQLVEVKKFQSGHMQPTPNTYGATICGNFYYGFWADITTNSFGLVSFDLVTIPTPNATYLDTPVLYHQLACDPSGSGLLAVGSVPASGGAQFSLRKYDIKAQTDTVVGNIPVIGYLGFDAVFSFNAAGTELYVGGGTEQSLVVGQQLIMDVATGKVTYGPKKYPYGQLPYLILPDTKPMQGMILTGGLNNPTHHWAQIDLGDKITVKKGANVEELFNLQHPAVCGKTLYTTNIASSDTWHLYQVDAGSGQILSTNDLLMPRNGHFIGGLACVSA